MKGEGGNSIPRGQCISCPKACKTNSKGCLYHIVMFKDLCSKAPYLESVPVVMDFPKVFLDDLPWIPPEQQIDICIDMMLNTKSISIPLFPIAPADLKEIKAQL